MLYDKSLINKTINRFKEQEYCPKDVDIYFDMDNTLCLFSPFGNVEESMRLMVQEGFYRELVCFPEAPAVIKNLLSIGYNVYILSSYIESPYCCPEKKAWVNYHLPFIPDNNIILVKNGDDKSNHIRNPQCSILVDDYNKNLIDFYNSGGIGVKKTYSGKERPLPQVESLVDIFTVLHNLNIK